MKRQVNLWQGLNYTVESAEAEEELFGQVVTDDSIRLESTDFETGIDWKDEIPEVEQEFYW